MSKENLEQFMDNVADSPQLQAKIGEKIDAALIALGAECGCEFTADELNAFKFRALAYINLKGDGFTIDSLKVLYRAFCETLKYQSRKMNNS